ncbi:hypothetical protein DICPUDRAFT_59316 [Dictyostelium purpureum]|uniref:NADH-ubiquinone oxidoreductase subunit B14.7 n=1 Tax=Dictyostelium purpureum TaxID=5786 RepID=F1A5G9_DICPU|nr:uncharacterized protein DICPUDRAFT_59316 [Dictyostelium purpureum]EGC28563.1 hypothetical protein DICPUDRAFT_59316 [Dictyostelium purpureum]|eukprot:XP_003294913.1 hypothetical protein DICPUDRAFT_59316 [Dictyostelium purpureum]
MTGSEKTLGGKAVNAGVVGAIGGSVVAFNKTFNYSVFTNDPKGFVNTSRPFFGQCITAGALGCAAYTITKHYLAEIRGTDDYLNSFGGSIVTAVTLGALSNSLKIGVKSGLILVPITFMAHILTNEVKSAQVLYESRYDTEAKQKVVRHKFLESLKQ